MFTAQIHRISRIFLFFFSLVFLCFIANRAIAEPEGISYDNWVGTIFKDRPETTLREMVIPGTHDSGSWAINDHSDVAPDAPKAYGLVKGIVAGWAKTQTFDFHHMLRMGVRHFDLRVQRHKGQFVLVHGLIGMPLSDALSQVRNFADAYPMEPVILEVAKTPGRDDWWPMIELFGIYLKPKLFKNSKPLAEITLGDLWKKDQFGETKNVIVVMNTGAGEIARHLGYFNGKDNFTGTWADTESVSTLKDRLLHGAVHESRKDFGLLNAPKNKLFWSAFTLTPHAKTILKDLFIKRSSGTIYQWTQDKLRPVIGEWLPEWEERGLRPNIITTDFFEYTAAVPMALRMNTVKPKPPAEKLRYLWVKDSTLTWSTQGTSASQYLEFRRPKSPDGYSIVGDVLITAAGESAIKTLVVADDQPGVARPLGYNWLWNDVGIGAHGPVSVWRPIPPKGFICLGDLAMNYHSTEPPKEMMQCIHESYLQPAQKVVHQWDETNSNAKFPVSLWKGVAVNGLSADTFIATRKHEAPPIGLFWSIANNHRQ